MKDEWQEEVEEVYRAALDLGYGAKRAQELSMARMKHLSLIEEQGDFTDEVNILLIYRKADVEDFLEAFDVKAFAKKHDITEDDAWDEAHYLLGYNPHKPIWENALIRQEGNKRVMDVFVCGEERTDPAWLSLKVGGKKVASIQAQVSGKGDKSLNRELNKISNSRGYG